MKEENGVQTSNQQRLATTDTKSTSESDKEDIKWKTPSTSDKAR